MIPPPPRIALLPVVNDQLAAPTADPGRVAPQRRRVEASASRLAAQAEEMRQVVAAFAEAGLEHLGLFCFEHDTDSFIRGFVDERRRLYAIAMTIQEPVDPGDPKDTTPAVALEVVSFGSEQALSHVTVPIFDPVDPPFAARVSVPGSSPAQLLEAHLADRGFDPLGVSADRFVDDYEHCHARIADWRMLYPPDAEEFAEILAAVEGGGHGLGHRLVASLEHLGMLRRNDARLRPLLASAAAEAGLVPADAAAPGSDFAFVHEYMPPKIAADLLSLPLGFDPEPDAEMLEAQLAAHADGGGAGGLDGEEIERQDARMQARDEVTWRLEEDDDDIRGTFAGLNDLAPESNRYRLVGSLEVALTETTLWVDIYRAPERPVPFTLDVSEDVDDE